MHACLFLTFSWLIIVIIVNSTVFLVFTWSHYVQLLLLLSAMPVFVTASLFALVHTLKWKKGSLIGLSLHSGSAVRPREDLITPLLSEISIFLLHLHTGSLGSVRLTVRFSVNSLIKAFSFPNCSGVVSNFYLRHCAHGHFQCRRHFCSIPQMCPLNSSVSELWQLWGLLYQCELCFHCHYGSWV